ncbi:hypothetical protein FOQG_03506 [Fusarium oxysporum f. sp. raphani 54005]|uniref:Uncharacterized protein n=5 Tax=Fusarium oxysporum TaxID=5507 RepID=X0CQP8_FUSOX|nr:hypothetical protein FOVG_00226 [Fusarium oxysporum f. sp. pisi HDV247]EXK96491.1 hypothetical protein FOQG_03506 [Fusarium oxysporum f. sp. raphani 54005]EXL82457.1 hypothetical protein FOPG_04672 [Fusarium oxysporum f. sp. conglutinans race 2 54008]KAG7438991.1 hypothetical protein Forpi1262_v000359 [Fusarium oxysporum f. sp. raphani]
MRELRSYSPVRRSLDFASFCSDLELPSNFYEYHFRRLGAEICTIVLSAFSPKQEHQAPRTSPWLRDYPEEFIRHVELVAHMDARAGKWERLLRDSGERTNLLQAIIFKALDNRVFSRLLFGAGSKHDETLHNSDVALINAEGFQRSELRAHTNRAWLKMSRGEPDLFWREVDKLTTEVYLLLLHVYEFTASFDGYEPISRTELYQLLHDVISYAGWLSVGLRMSSAIVSINWLIPGELHALDQVSTCQPAYEASKEAAQQQGMRLQEQRPERKQISSMARVKISVIPEIIRYRPYPKEANVEGIDSYRMMEPHAVHYHGLQEEHDENRAFISLPDYIKKLRDRNCAPRNAALVIMVTILICLWVLYTTSGQQTWQEAKGWVNPEPGPEPEKSWWSLTW